MTEGHLQDHAHPHDHTDGHDHAHTHEDNSHAGKGAVMLDIGGSVGALVVRMPDSMLGQEVEICPTGEEHSAEIRAHVAVLARPLGDRKVATLVFPALEEGSYELYVKPHGPTELVVNVMGGLAVEAEWPS